MTYQEPSNELSDDARDMHRAIESLKVTSNNCCQQDGFYFGDLTPYNLKSNKKEQRNEHSSQW